MSSRILALVRESKHEPNIVMDRDAAALEQRRSVAPLANGSYGRRDKWFRAAHRLDALDVPVSSNHSVQSDGAFNPLLLGFDGVRRRDLS
jgi:hypothetical protein